MSSETVIELVGVEKRYKRGGKQFPALHSINLEIKRGEFVIIQGPSGAGKTTMLNMMTGIDLPTEGRVLIEKQEITGKSEEERARIRREKIGIIFQFFNLIDDLTVLENVMVPLFPSEESIRTIRLKAEEALDAVGMLGKKDKYPRELSGGEQQRVAIARAIVNKPSILIADEPTAQLDEENAQKVVEILRKLNQQGEATVVLATASETVTDMFRDLATKIIKIERGRIVEIQERAI